MANTTRQTGTVVGIALLGALVQTRAVHAASAALSSLPSGEAARLAATLGHAGAQAQLPTPLPGGISATKLHEIAADAYVSGIHGGFAVGGFVLLSAAVVAAFVLRAPATERDVEEDEPVAKDASESTPSTV